MVAIFTGSAFGFERGSAAVLGQAGLLGSAAQGWGGEGVYVNAANGNLLLQKQDEVLIGRGPDIGISRTYNSLTSLADDNNDKWRQSTDRRVYGLTGTLNAAGSTVRRVSGDGTEIVYAWDGGAGAYVTKESGGAYDRIVRSGAEWIWTDGDTQTVERYFTDTSGKIKSATDRNGLALTFTYDGSNRLDKVTSSDGAWIRYDYAGSTHNITQIVTGYTDLATSTAKTLTRTRYGYDGSNRLTTVTVDLTPGDNSVLDGAKYVTTYSYDVAGRVSNIAQSDGSNLAITYDGSARVATLVQTASAGVTRTTSFGYGALYTSITDPSGQTTRLDYDAAGNLTKITAPPAYTGAAQQIVQFAYNAAGDLISTTDAAGQITAFSNFTGSGLAQTVTERLNSTVTRTYSTANLLLSETRSGVDASGTAVSQTARFVHDAAGNLRFAISAEGRVTEYTRNSAGDVSYETVYVEAGYTAPGTPTEAAMTTWVSGLSDKSWVQKTKYLYDARGALQSVTSYGIANSAGTEQTSDGTSVSSFVYDQAGQLLSSYSGANTATTYIYDGMGRVVGTTDANGGTTTMVYNAGSLTTTVTLASGYVSTKTYNQAGDLVAETDSGANTTGGTTSYAYDKLGRVRVRTDAAGVATYFIYDHAGRLVGEVTNGGELVEYRYDANNRLIGTVYYHNWLSAASMTSLANSTSAVEVASIRPAAHFEDIASWTVYDAEGRVLQTIAGDGSTAISTYDASGRLQKTTAYTNKIAQGTVDAFVSASPSGVIAPTASSTDAVARMFYDKDGLTIGRLSGEGYLTRNAYDQAGRLTTTTQYAVATSGSLRAGGSFAALLASVGTSAQDRTSRFVHDGQGLLRYSVDALNQVVRFDYDSAGQQVRTAVYAAPLGTTSDFTYDNVKSLAAGLEASSSKRVSYAVYDAAGRLAYGIDALGAVTGYTYDNRGHVTKTLQYAAPDAVSSLPTVATMNAWAGSHAYDGGNRTTRTWYTARGEAAYSIDAEGNVSRRTYNARGDMVAVTAWDHPVAILDGVAISQISSAVGSDTFVTRTYGYDALGRLEFEWDGNVPGSGAYTGAKTVYHYTGATDIHTGLTRAANGTAQELRHDYSLHDQAGRLVQQNNGVWTDELAVSTRAYDGQGNLTATYDPRGKMTTYTRDLDGQVRAITDALGGVTSYEYNAFGEVWKTTDPNGSVTYAWHDKLGRVTTTRDAAGYLTETDYTVFGEVASVQRWMTAAVGTPVMSGEPVGSGTRATTTFAYDALGRVLSSNDALNHAESYTYDAFGNRITTTSRLGRTTQFAYDRLGRLVREGVASESWNDTVGGSTIQSFYKVSTYAYDARGNLIQTQEGFASAELTGPVTALRTTSYVYDRADRLTVVNHNSVTTLDGDWITTHAGVIPQEIYTYDLRGNVLKTIDVAGASTYAYYDHLDRKIAEIRHLAIDAFSGSSTWVYSAYAYDPNGNLTGTKVYEGNPYPSGTPPLGGTPPSPPAGSYRETRFSYDNLNRILTSSVVGADDAIISGSWNGSSFTINHGVGAVAQAPTTSYEYDAAGNLVKLTDPNGNAAWTWYDALDRKVAQLDGENYLTKWVYDAEGNVTREVRYASRFGGAPSTAVEPGVSANSADRITDFEYDLTGNRTKEIRRNVAAWSVDLWTGALTPASSTDSIIDYAYNALGQVTTKTVAGILAAGYEYDQTGRLVRETRGAIYDVNDTMVTPTTEYAYDALGDLVTTTQLGTSAGTVTTANRTTRYRYGEGGRLLSTEDAMGNVHTYFYDSADV